MTVICMKILNVAQMYIGAEIKTFRTLDYTPSVGKVVAKLHRWLIKYEKNSGRTY